MSVVIVDEELRAVQGADAALERLARAGHEVVPAGEARAETILTRAVPVRHGSARAWHLVASPDGCVGRRSGVTTMLVGPRRPPGRGPTRRCDLEARDVDAAVLEILAREAMPEPPEPPRRGPG